MRLQRWPLTTARHTPGPNAFRLSETLKFSGLGSSITIGSLDDLLSRDTQCTIIILKSSLLLIEKCGSHLHLLVNWDDPKTRQE